MGTVDATISCNLRVGVEDGTGTVEQDHQEGTLVVVAEIAVAVARTTTTLTMDVFPNMSSLDDPRT
ncbi:hypothetical protein PMIN05_005171 [Paraphaeosphaeria minitans]